MAKAVVGKRSHELGREPGVYEWDAVAVNEGVVPPVIECGRVRFVSDVKGAGNAYATFDVRLTSDGALEVRCNEGRLLVTPVSGNEIRITNGEF